MSQIRYLVDEDTPHAIRDGLLRRQPEIEIRVVGGDMAPSLGTRRKPAKRQFEAERSEQTPIFSAGWKAKDISSFHVIEARCLSTCASIWRQEDTSPVLSFYVPNPLSAGLLMSSY